MSFKPRALRASGSTQIADVGLAGGRSGARVLEGARVVGAAAGSPFIGGVRIEGAVTTHIFAGPCPPELDGESIDLAGCAILPGLTDAHFHLRGVGSVARQIDLRGLRSPEEVASRIASAAANTPPGAWIRGRGWDQNGWRCRALPTHEVLDEAVGDHPVWLTRVDGHAVWLNSEAMRLASIDGSTSAPAGGEILRGAAGAPTGVFVDNAIDLVAGQLPGPTASEVRADFELALELCAQAGLTGVHDMGTTSMELAVLRSLEREGALTLRVHVYLGGEWSDVTAAMSSPPNREGLVRVVGAKLYADGALGSHGAALLAPYTDRPETSGLMLTAPEELRRKVTAIDRAGYQVAIHAIGDRGNREALEAIEALGEGERGLRPPRVEHAQVVAPSDIARFGALGAVASMQPTHATSDMGWVEARIGLERIEGAYAWRSMKEAGALLVFGSDAPIEELDPWLGVHAAVTRQSADGEPPGGWRAGERVSLEQAIGAFSRDAARAAGSVDLGDLRVGATADLTVVTPDPFRLDASELTSVRTARTIVGGVDVYVASDR